MWINHHALMEHQQNALNVNIVSIIALKTISNGMGKNAMNSQLIFQFHFSVAIIWV